MLRELSVQNLALIEDVRVELTSGYCAWTGETGAGKSLLLTALGLVLGGKSSGELVRHGKEEARASAVFEIGDPLLRAEIEALLPVPLEDDQLILTRRVSSQGRSACHANEAPVTVATLRSLGHRLIDIHSQHEGRALVDPDHQRRLLDAYGKHQDHLDAYAEARESFDALLRRRRELIDGAERRERELEMLRFEVEDLRASEPRRGEFAELGREASRLASAENLREAAESGYKLLYEDDRSAQELLSRVARKLEPLSNAVPAFADAAGELERLSDETREIAYTLRRLGEDFADDPDRLEEVETRLALYRRLTGRYRCEADALEERLTRSEARLSELEVESTALDSLDVPRAEAWARLRAAADSLSRVRGESALRMSAELQQQLRRVSLEHAKIEVSLSREELPGSPPDESPPAHGLDRVEFVFASNPGEPARPLRKVASGGELSRVTLAIKTVLAGVDRTPTLVFDEVDTGVGGRLGAALGRNLGELAGHHQVICITHLPQMACHADRQWVIRKRTERGRTRTTIRLLDEKERIEELAAMLRGDSADDRTRQEAESMLREAREAGRRSGQTLSKSRR